MRADVGLAAAPRSRVPKDDKCEVKIPARGGEVQVEASHDPGADCPYRQKSKSYTKNNQESTILHWYTRYMYLLKDSIQ